MLDFFNTIAAVFAVAAIGYACAGSRILSEETGDHLTKFVFTIAIPLALFRTMIAADFGAATPWRLWVAYFIGVYSTWLLGHLIIRYVFGRGARAGVVAGVAASFSNLVLVGTPVVLGLFGQAGFEILALIISIHLVVMMLTSILAFEWAMVADGVADVRPSVATIAQKFVRDLFSNPIVLGILAGWLWRFAGLSLPEFMDRVTSTLAATAGPVALFAMGMGLFKFGFTGNIPQALAMSFCKLVFMPLIVLLAGYSLGLPVFVLQMALVAAAMPTGVNPYLIATHFGTGQGLASNTMTIGTVGSALTLAVWLYIFEKLGFAVTWPAQ